MLEEELLRWEREQMAEVWGAQLCAPWCWGGPVLGWITLGWVVVLQQGLPGLKAPTLAPAG